MNAGGVPKTCKSSGKALHLVFDRDNLFKIIAADQFDPWRGRCGTGRSNHKCRVHERRTGE